MFAHNGPFNILSSNMILKHVTLGGSPYLLNDIRKESAHAQFNFKLVRAYQNGSKNLHKLDLISTRSFIELGWVDISSTHVNPKPT